MIAKVLDGWRPSGLIAYLFGPGKFEEHRNPRVVGSWDGVPLAHHPRKLGPGEFDVDLRALIKVMQELPAEFGLPLSTPPATPDWLPEAELWVEWLRAAGRRTPPSSAPDWVRHYRWDEKAGAVVLKKGYVWHTPVRLHPGDRVLSDADWQTIAQTLMEATGLHQEGCRWIAVRHADDHIHLVATLVSDKGGILRRVHPRNDYLKLRAACQQLERRFGLHATPDVDWTARKPATQAEQRKAQRLGIKVARDILHRDVSAAAAAAVDAASFTNRLRKAGVKVQHTHTADGAVRGIRFSRDGDFDTHGRPVWYGGGTLASDLTWPKLQQRWATTPAVEPIDITAGRISPETRLRLLEETTDTIATARIETEDPDGVAHAFGEVLSSLAAAREGPRGGPISHAADQFDRAARTPRIVFPTDIGAHARALRRASRRLAALGVIPGVGAERYALAALILAVAGLVAEIQAHRHAAARPHQAAAAARAHQALPLAKATTDWTNGQRFQRPAPAPAAQPVPPPRPTHTPPPLAARPAWQPHRTNPHHGPGRRPGRSP